MVAHVSNREAQKKDAIPADDWIFSELALEPWGGSLGSFDSLQNAMGFVGTVFLALSSYRMCSGREDRLDHRRQARLPFPRMSSKIWVTLF